MMVNRRTAGLLAKAARAGAALIGLGSLIVGLIFLWYGRHDPHALVLLAGLAATSVSLVFLGSSFILSQRPALRTMGLVLGLAGIVGCTYLVVLFV